MCDVIVVLLINKGKEIRMDLPEMIAKAMNVEPILSRSDIKAIALANISNTLAVNTSKGRTVYMSSIAKDINAAQSMAAGGLDLNMLLMMQMMDGGAKKVAEVAKEEAKDPDLKDVLTTIVDRLDGLDAAVKANKPARKGVG